MVGAKRLLRWRFPISRPSGSLPKFPRPKTPPPWPMTVARSDGGFPPRRAPRAARPRVRRAGELPWATLAAPARAPAAQTLAARRGDERCRHFAAMCGT